MPTPNTDVVEVEGTQVTNKGTRVPGGTRVKVGAGV